MAVVFQVLYENLPVVSLRKVSERVVYFPRLRRVLK